MKRLRYLGLLPLLLVVGCKETAKYSNKLESGAYYNVHYVYAYARHCYYVYLDTNVDNEHPYIVPPKNVYYIKYVEYLPSLIKIENEYFTDTNELFVYEE